MTVSGITTNYNKVVEETDELDGSLTQLTQLAQKETDDIDSAIASLSNKVDAETQEIDSSLINRTKQIEDAKQWIGKVYSQTKKKEFNDDNFIPC